MAMIVIIVGTIYALTVARGYSWMHWGTDAGDLITSVYTFGIPHPPGTPVYVLFAQPFRLLPFGTPAFKINLASTVFGLAAVGLVTKMVWDLTKNFFAALAAGLFLALGPVFWSQSVIAEVYTLNALLSGLVIFAIVRWLISESERWLYAAVFFLGLALANHTTSAMLVPAIFYLVISRLGANLFKPRRIIRLGVGLALGLSPYLYILLRARQNPPLNWGGPDTLARFLAHVTAQEYGKMLFYQSPVLVLDATSSFFVSLVNTFSYIGVLLAAIGLVIARHDFKLKMFTGFVFIFQLLFVSEYKIVNIETFNLIAFWMFAVWVGLGIEVMGELSAELVPWLRKRVSVLFLSLEKPACLGGGRFDYPLADLLLLLPVLALVMIPIWRVRRFYHQIDASSNNEAIAYIDSAVSAVKPNAIVITEGDRFSFTFDYIRWVYPPRDDIKVVGNGMYMQGWRLEQYRRLYPELEFPDKPITKDPRQALDQLFTFIEANIDDHPVYFTLDYPYPEPTVVHRLELDDWVIQSDGVVYEVLGKKSRIYND